MSDQTQEALEQALAAHMSDECDGPVMLTGYILQACGQGMDEDGTMPILYSGLAGQSMILAQGLLAYINENVNQLSFNRDEEDD